MNTQKKNQHYVPKFYLRHFSCYGNKTQIGIFNLKNKRYIPSGPLKHQGSRNFFYGYDGVVEESLSEIEGKFSTVIKEILANRRIPDRDSESYFYLLFFVAITDLRNPVVIDKAIKSNEVQKQRLLELQPDMDVTKFVPEITHEDAVGYSLSSAEHVIKIIKDLKVKLIFNKTTRPFITSDFPVVKYNQFLEFRNWAHGKTGYGHIGLQILLPLTPEVAIILYDPAIYKIGNKKDEYLDVTNSDDIDQINMLQFVNCIDTIFFQQDASEVYIRNLQAGTSRFQKANQVTSELSYMIKPNEPRPTRKNLLQIGSTDCETKLKISGIKIHSGAQHMKLDDRVAQLRPWATYLMEQRDK